MHETRSNNESLRGSWTRCRRPDGLHRNDLRRDACTHRRCRQRIRAPVLNPIVISQVESLPDCSPDTDPTATPGRRCCGQMAGSTPLADRGRRTGDSFALHSPSEMGSHRPAREREADGRRRATVGPTELAEPRSARVSFRKTMSSWLCPQETTLRDRSCGVANVKNRGGSALRELPHVSPMGKSRGAPLLWDRFPQHIQWPCRHPPSQMSE